MPLVASIKLSFLFFYRRVFSPSRKTVLFVNGGVVVISCAYIAIFFATVFDCIPVSKRWYPSKPGWCARPKFLPYTSGAINVSIDIYVLIVPIPCIWGLNMSFSRKLRILAVFSLGILWVDQCYLFQTDVVDSGFTGWLSQSTYQSIHSGMLQPFPYSLTSDMIHRRF